ncbi:DUF6933 domain-containing protein [Paenibacillus sp. MDMC362]|uniref:DUF6933 domain-containing protein n=1 Tax=Paenibacillus sp. MDMC362 TaxID=2977365 RepID=UPI0021A295B1|nr:hypothetical protein [Paenibacillus sp. MDMC362]
MINLIVLRFTQSLMKDMKVTPNDFDGSALFSWHANIYKLNNRKHILFVNDFSRLCIIIDGVRTSQLTLLKEKFQATLKAYLTAEEVEEKSIVQYMKYTSEMMISRTNNRSVLGTMKEISIFESDDFIDNIQRLKWLNRLIYKPIDYNEPIKEFKKHIQEIN